MLHPYINRIVYQKVLDHNMKIKFIAKLPVFE